MIKSAIEYVVGLKEGQKPVVEVDGRKYSNNNGALQPILDPMPCTLNFSTLSGLVDWAAQYGKNGLAELPYFVVNSHDRVSLMSTLEGVHRQRFVIAQAKYESPEFPYDRFIETEEFIVATQVRFKMTDTLKELVKLVGNVSEGEVRTQRDDGITQTATVQKTVGSVDKVKLPNPINLQPYKTFSGIDAPLIPHIFRGKDGPRWALFEADDAVWVMKTKVKIKEWVTKHAPNHNVFA